MAKLLILLLFGVVGSFGIQKEFLAAQPRKSVEKTFIITLATKLVEQPEKVAWEQTNEITAYPGRTVSVKMSAESLQIMIRATPYLDEDDTVSLLLQSEVVVVPREKEEDDLHYYSTVRQLKVKTGEKVLFFPIGQNDTFIEMEILVEAE